MLKYIELSKKEKYIMIHTLDTIMSEYTILPLINAAFQPGEAKKMVDSFEDRDFQKI